MLAPALAAAAVLVLLPVLDTLWLSLHDVILYLYRPRSRPFTGLANYAHALRDPVFWESLGNSLVWVICAVSLQFTLGFTSALLLNRNFAWRGIARALVVVPWALPSVIIGLIWTWMLDFNLGVLNNIGVRLGILPHSVPWLAQPSTAMAGVIVAVMWQGSPFFAVTLLAGLQALPGELYEAAAIDGVGAWGRKVPPYHVAGPRRGYRNGAAVAHDLGGELARPDPGDDRRWARHGHADVAVARVSHGVVGRQLRPGFRACRAADTAVAWCGGDVRLAESRRMTIDAARRLKRLLGTELPIILILGFALLPWFWMMLSSIRPDAELTHSPIALWPHQLTLIHHIDLLKRTSFAQNLRDSLIVACGAVTLGLTLALPAAYAFSRFRFRGRNWLRTQFLVINMFPVVMLILPLFVLMRDFGLLDTYFALIAGHATFTLPFAIWLLTSYVDGIPQELDQAAMIDGATRMQAMLLVVLPLAMPGVVAVGIYLFITSWNEYLFALMMTGHNVRTVTVALQLFIGENQIQWGLLMAGGTLVALPATILFLFAQRRLVGGLTGGAVKG
jgi:multiple sugar transport system permease protein